MESIIYYQYEHYAVNRQHDSPIYIGLCRYVGKTAQYSNRQTADSRQNTTNVGCRYLKTNNIQTLTL